MRALTLLLALALSVSPGFASEPTTHSLTWQDLRRSVSHWPQTDRDQTVEIAIYDAHGAYMGCVKAKRIKAGLFSHYLVAGFRYASFC